jgi:RNA polymerase sigma factor (sigma-70 family)
MIESEAEELIGLDDALKSLAEIDQRKCQVIELRYFGGLTIEETAEALGVSHTTVEDDWKMARAWLRRQMTKTFYFIQV